MNLFNKLNFLYYKDALFLQVKKYCKGKEDKALSSLLMKALNETQMKGHPVLMKKIFTELLEEQKQK